jgi:hypothetical protein
LTETIQEAQAKTLAKVDDVGQIVAGQASDDHGIQGGFIFIVVPTNGSDVNQWLAELARRCPMAAVRPWPE